MRDMVPPERRSIRNIPVSPSRRRQEGIAIPREDMDDGMEDAPVLRERPAAPRRRPARRKRIFLFLAAIVVAVCAIGGLLLSTLFAGAVVTVYPKEEQVTPPKTLLAKANAAAGELAYQTVTVTRSASTTATASGTKQASRSASGTIVVYNAAGPESQRLIANTRFEAPDGKIYRIRDSIVVPGAATAADGTLTPGSVSVTAYADSPGAAYNRGETRFTIPGFKSDPRYSKFYAQATSISGGFVGTEPAVAAADLARAEEALKQGLGSAGQSALTAQIPEGYIAIPGTLQVTFSDISQTPEDADSVVVSQSATVAGAVVQTGELAAAIARATVEGYQGEPVGFSDLTEITFAATTTKSKDEVQLVLSGSPTLVWAYDAAALTAALLGKEKTAFQDIVESFAPAIVRAEAKVRPFWQGKFPDDAGKIRVETGEQAQK